MTADLAGQITEFGIGVAPAGISAAKMLRAPKSPKFPQRYSQGPVTFENVADDLANNKPSVKNAPEAIAASPKVDAPSKLAIPTGAPGSPEHKALRWEEYQARGGEWSYERWEKTYSLNMERATQAHEAVNKYHSQLGWGKREVTIDVEGVPRRLDIAEVARQRGVEYKTGYQSRTQDNLWEITRDEALVKQGWSIEWVFEGKASEPLINELTKAGIKHSFR